MGVYQLLKSSFYVPGVDHRKLADRSKQVLLRRVPSFPKDIQIQTRTACNAACVFCPFEASYNHVPKGKMDDGLFEKIVAEIARYGVTRRISPYLMNEPFLDKTLIEKSRHIHRMVPKGKVVVTTNAGVLTRDLVDEILRENPFHAIYISMQGIEKEAYEATMRGRMNFEKTKENVEYLVDQRNKLQPGFKVVVTMVQTNLVDVAKAVAYWQSRGVESKYTPLENRGGNIEAFDGLNPCTKRVYKDCTRLMKHAYILFNGDMVLCCTDYYKTMVLGNVAETSLHEVWNSERAVGIRRNFLRGDLSENPLCANCYIADTKGGS